MGASRWLRSAVIPILLSLDRLLMSFSKRFVLIFGFTKRLYPAYIVLEISQIAMNLWKRFPRARRAIFVPTKPILCVARVKMCGI